MHKQNLEHLHFIRNDLEELRELFHFHGEGQHRQRAMALLSRASNNLNLMYSMCLSCEPEDRNDEQEEDQTKMGKKGSVHVPSLAAENGLLLAVAKTMVSTMPMGAKRKRSKTD